MIWVFTPRQRARYPGDHRAGRAAGLDRDDVVIRRRVRQKMEFLAEEDSAPQHTEETLEFEFLCQCAVIAKSGPLNRRRPPTGAASKHSCGANLSALR